jgi:hypothetical protein
LRRLYDALLRTHFERHRQMAFVSGPRQVGKTTTSRTVADPDRYLSWDDEDDRALFLAGPAAVAARLGLEALRARRSVAAFDELHKYPRWKTFLKGFFDKHEERVRLIVTGSSRLDVYRRGGDSLMGRYFSFRMHPLSVAELLRPEVPSGVGTRPSKLPESSFETLFRHGGYPEPFTRNDERFSRRWRSTRQDQLVREDLRELTRLHQVGQVEHLARVLLTRSGTQITYQSLASEARVSPDTAREWVEVLASLHLGFVVRPWFKNVARALRKEPKWYLYDWSGIADPGQRAETFIACHLLKAVHAWTDLGMGTFDLHYVRDKEKREVDFLIVRDDEPWVLAEVKTSRAPPSPALEHFRKATKAAHAFQVTLDLPFEEADCFAHHGPIVVPARTFLSQLV